MSEIAKTGTPSVSSVTPAQNSTLVGLLAGEAIAAGDACYVKSDGRIWKSTGAAVNAAAKVRGYAFFQADIGEPVTLYTNCNWRYGAGLTPGADVFVSATVPGGLSDAPTTGGTAPIGYVVDATRIHLRSSGY